MDIERWVRKVRVTVTVDPDCRICDGTGVRSETTGVGLVYTTEGRSSGHIESREVPCHCARLHVPGATTSRVDW